MNEIKSQRRVQPTPTPSSPCLLPHPQLFERSGDPTYLQAIEAHVVAGMTSSAVRGGRKRRLLSCLPSCLSAPSVSDHVGSEPPPETSPLARSPNSFFWRRLRRGIRTVPVEDVAGEDVGGSHAASSGDAAPPKDYRQAELFQKLHKEPKRIKTNSKPLAEKLSSRAHNGSSACHVLTKYNTRRQPAPPLHRVREPVQTGISRSHPGSPNPSRPTGSAAATTHATRRLDSASVLLLLATAVTVTLFCGRVCAVFCGCAWFYFRPYVRRPPPLKAPQPLGTEEIDFGSAEYKKKVVMMGLLDRNRSPIASPIRTR